MGHRAQERAYRPEEPKGSHPPTAALNLLRRRGQAQIQGAPDGRVSKDARR